MLPPMLALHLLAADENAQVVLLCCDEAVGGFEVEPVVVGRLSPAARRLAEPCCVAAWPGYDTIRDGTIHAHADDVWLLDPVQLWLEFEPFSERCKIITGCLSPGDQVTDERLIDLSPLIEAPAPEQIVGIELARQLGRPVLADHDAAGDGWAGHQLIPLGDDRLIVRKLPLRESLVAANSTFESLLNALVAP